MPPIDKSRREFLLQLSNIGIIVGAGAVTTYGIYEARRKPGIVNISIPIAELPKDFVGFKIVQITDIHAGLTVKRNWIETIVEEVNNLNPDLIALTGDIVDGSTSHLREDVAPLGELHAHYGKFFVTGNHEYYSGVENWIKEFTRFGYDVLINEHRNIQRNDSAIVLAGVTDYTGGRFLPSHKSNPKISIQDVPSDLVKILLAHQPRTIRDSETLGFNLMLSGHTHGGQFFPWNLVAALGQPYISGLHKHLIVPTSTNTIESDERVNNSGNEMWVYVSKGTGYWGPPVRLGARSEITVITLTNEKTT